MAAEPRDTDSFRSRPNPGRLAPKLMRLVDEVHLGSLGAFEAFHLYVFLKVEVFPKWDDGPYGTIGNNSDKKKVEFRISTIWKAARSAHFPRAKKSTTLFLNSAAARRKAWTAMPADCMSCEYQAPQPYLPCPTHMPFLPQSYGHCQRRGNLDFIEQLQKMAYSEIRSGVMLTLARKLPKEICISIFELVSTVKMHHIF